MKKFKNVLNLDPKFNPFSIDDELMDFETFTFNGGELQFRLTNEFQENKGHTLITHRIRNGNDIMLIALATDALRRFGFKHISLLIPYVPYARQDRVCNQGESFSLKVFANIINSLNFDTVYGLDAHSDVTSALINNFENTSPLPIIRTIVGQHSPELVLVSPDGGAHKKVITIANSLKESHQIIFCNKQRNPKDGKLGNFEVFSTDLQGKDCLIIDDICDGGRTFIEIAKKLKEKNCGKLYLYVTHGIFSQGFAELREHFEKIYSTNSFKDIDCSVEDRDSINIYKIFSSIIFSNY